MSLSLSRDKHFASLKFFFFFSENKRNTQKNDDDDDDNVPVQCYLFVALDPKAKQKKNALFTFLNVFFFFTRSFKATNNIKIYNANQNSGMAAVLIYFV